MTDRQPGSYLLDAAGNPQPNLEDSAMAERMKIAEEGKAEENQANSPQPPLDPSGGARKVKKEVVNNANHQ